MKREAAFLSDVHGNLPALEAVLADLSRRGITEVYFLGDVLGKGPAVGEVISLLRARCSGAVYGNWDKLVLHGKDVERFGASYYRERLSAEDRAYLLSLPESLEIDFCGRSVLMYHGRFSINCVVTPMFNNSRDNVEKALYRFGPHDITLMGDAHHPFMLTHQGRFLMNTGAVGNPCDRMPLASYLILRDENGVFSSEHVRVPYDLNRAVSIALHTPQLPMLETYINETVTAVYSRSYKPNTNTPQTNPWEELPLSVYQLQTGVLGLREPLDKLLHNQLRDHPAKSYLLFGITDGSGLENAPLAHDTRIIGVDINVLEYIGVNPFARQIAAIKPAAVSCAVLHGAAGLALSTEIKRQFREVEFSHLTDAMEELDYRLTSLTSEPLPGGALLLRLDFAQ